jgi:hypothetical protein
MAATIRHAPRPPRNDACLTCVATMLQPVHTRAKTYRRDGSRRVGIELNRVRSSARGFAIDVVTIDTGRLFPEICPHDFRKGRIGGRHFDSPCVDGTIAHAIAFVSEAHCAAHPLLLRNDASFGFNDASFSRIRNVARSLGENNVFLPI